MNLAPDTTRVLLIDDDPFLLKILARQLASFGYREVLKCEQAQQALSLVQGQEPPLGLIFCDLNMPEMDGVEFIRELARLDYRGSLVLVSGEEERLLETTRKLALAHGINVLGALRKPISTEHLEKLLGGAAPIRQPPRAARKNFGPEELRVGIDLGQLENHYQPKIELRSGKVIGVETLVRWRNPDHGLVFPDQFIGAAEEHGLIGEVTYVVLSEALRQCRRWREEGLELRVAVNVSVEDLVSLDFPDVVGRAARDAGVSPSSLVLEVTESRLMKNPLAALEILTRLRLKRVGLSIDDFGTGHSSLAQLRDIPFDELKIDRGFVHGAHADGARRAILEASLAMAQQLGIKSVAEGVEDRQDWDFLRNTGCDVMQGYFASRPVPAAEFSAWLPRWELRRQELLGSPGAG